MEMTISQGFSPTGEIVFAEDLLELLRHIDQNNVNGALVIKSNNIERSIFLQNERIVFASSTKAEESLGHFLVQQKKITQSQYEVASRAVLDGNKRLGRVLLEMSILKYNDLWEAVTRHLIKIVFSCFQVESGAYKLVAGECLQEENILINLNITDVILEAMRRFALPKDPDRFLRKIRRFYITDQARHEKMLLMPYERHIITLIERNHTIEEVLKKSELLMHDTKRILVMLKILGVISEELIEKDSGVTEDIGKSSTTTFISFEESLKYYNNLFEMIYKMLKKEIGPIAYSIIQNALDDIRERLPGPFKKAEILNDGRVNDQILQKSIWFSDASKKMGEFIAALDEILYAEIFAVKKNLGVEFEQQILRWVRGDRN